MKLSGVDNLFLQSSHRLVKQALIILFGIGLLFSLQSQEKPLPKDVKELTVLAEKGDAEAQFELAEKFFYGKGVEKDYAQTFKWASRSAAQDNPKAKYRLGSLYIQGRGVAKDEKKAKALFKESKIGLLNLADRNDPQAQFSLGWMYAEGSGVEKDEKGAVKWYRKAAEQNVAAAQFSLGNMYYYGEGVEKDEEEAVKWYRKTAEQGNAKAKILLKDAESRAAMKKMELRWESGPKIFAAVKGVQLGMNLAEAKKTMEKRGNKTKYQREKNWVDLVVEGKDACVLTASDKDGIVYLIEFKDWRKVFGGRGITFMEFGNEFFKHYKISTLSVKEEENRPFSGAKFSLRTKNRVYKNMKDGYSIQ